MFTYIDILMNRRCVIMIPFLCACRHCGIVSLSLFLALSLYLVFFLSLSLYIYVCIVDLQHTISIFINA